MRGLFLVLCGLLLAACYSNPQPYGPPPGYYPPPPQQPIYYPPPPPVTPMPPPVQGVDTGGSCGGFRAVPAVCGRPTDYCKIDISGFCGAADAPGICTPRPQICTQEAIPVCGCDGQTYANACIAASNGVSIAAMGVCAPAQ